MKINFERIEIFTDMTKTKCVVQDVKKDFADIIYQFGRGIESHALALKIFNSKGETEYDEQECNLIRQLSELCSPSFMDAMKKVLNE